MFLTIIAVFLIIFGVIYGSKAFNNHTSIGMSSFMFSIAMFFGGLSILSHQFL